MWANIRAQKITRDIFRRANKRVNIEPILVYRTFFEVLSRVWFLRVRHQFCNDMIIFSKWDQHDISVYRNWHFLIIRALQNLSIQITYIAFSYIWLKTCRAGKKCAAFISFFHYFPLQVTTWKWVAQTEIALSFGFLANLAQKSTRWQIQFFNLLAQKVACFASDSKLDLWNIFPRGLK